MKCKIGKTTVVVERGDITDAEVDVPPKVITASGQCVSSTMITSVSSG